MLQAARVQRGSCTGRLRVCSPHEEAAGDHDRGICRRNFLNHPTIRVSPANWLSTLFNVWVVQILLAEQLQIPVQVVQYAGSDDHQFYEHAASGEIQLPSRAYNWDAIVRASADLSCAGYPTNPTTPAEECSHAMLELWSGQDSMKRTHVSEYGGTGKVAYGGALGALGRIGWYANNEVLDHTPEFASFRGLRDANLTASHFRRPLRFSEACARGVDSLLALCAAFAA